MTGMSAELLVAATRAGKLRPSDSALLRKTGPPPSQARRGAWVPAIEAGNWDRLLSLTAQDVRNRQTSLKRLRRLMAQAGDYARQLDELQPVARMLTKPAAHDDAAVTAHMRAAGMSQKQIDRAFSIRDGLDGDDVVRAARTIAQQQAQAADEVAIGHLRSVAAALHGSAVASLNTATDSATDPTALMTAARRDIASAWSAIGAALHSGSKARIAVAASALGQTAAAHMPKVISASLAQTSGGSPYTVAQTRAAVHAGDLIRAALTAQLAAIRIWWLLSAPENLPARRAWWSPPDAPAFTARSRADTTIEAAKARGVADGSAIRILGFVIDVAVTHRRRKAISTATVADSRGRELAVVLPYIKIDSGGIVAGSPVLLGGRWHDLSAETGGPALHLEIVSRRDRAAESLHDWATWLLRGIYQPVPHGLDASWGWTRGIDGPANPIRYGIWYDRKAV